MEQHFVFESVFGIHDRVEAFVLNLDQLGRVIGNMRRSSDHRGDRLTLVARFRHRKWIILDSRKRIRPDFNKRLSLLSHFRAGECANHTRNCFRR